MHAAGQLRSELVMKVVPSETGDSHLRDRSSFTSAGQAASFVHHLADQRAAINTLADLLGLGGGFALVEGGLPSRHMTGISASEHPDLRCDSRPPSTAGSGVCVPSFPGSVRLPYGWTDALRHIGTRGAARRLTAAQIRPQRIAPLARSSGSVPAAARRSPGTARPSRPGTGRRPRDDRWGTAAGA
jgi:hypothetical protein